MAFSTILIVGANRGIGLGLVEEVIKTSSAKVFATARAPEKATALNDLVKAHPNRLVVLKADMLNPASLKESAAELSKHTSTLDAAIFNAGTLEGQGKIEDLKPEDLLENLNANVVGPHNLLKAFSPFLVASKSEKKTIALIGSIVASLGALPGVAGFMKNMLKVDFLPVGGYSVTKTGLNMLGRQWADSLEPQGVSVVIVHPGAVATDMNQGDGDGLISVAESAAGVIKVVEKAELKDGATGILSYDGSVIPW